MSGKINLERIRCINRSRAVYGGDPPGFVFRIVLLSILIMLPFASVKADDDLGYPLCLIHLPPDQTTHVVLVEKSSAKVFLYVHNEKGLTLQETFPCSIGRVRGEKKENGDQKTPSGIFWLEEYIPGADLPREYGSGALVLNYPNYFDRFSERGGNGIWIHGTHLPDRVRYPRDTDGCVVVSNDDFEKIRTFVRLFETPVIIQKKIRFASEEQWRNTQVRFLGRFEQWKDTWRDDGYGSEPNGLYSKNFQSDPQGVKHLLRVRKALAGELKGTRIRIKNLMVLRNGSQALSTFVQEWQTSWRTSRLARAVYWMYEEREWKVLGEELLERPLGYFENISKQEAGERNHDGTGVFAESRFE